MCFRSPAGVFDFRMGREREGPNGAAIRVQEISQSLGKRCVTMYALLLNRRNLPARSVPRHSSGNERCGHPAASVGVSSLAPDA